MSAPVCSVLIIDFVKSVRFSTIDRFEPKLEDANAECRGRLHAVEDGVDAVIGVEVGVGSAESMPERGRS